MHTQNCKLNLWFMNKIKQQIFYEMKKYIKRKSCGKLKYEEIGNSYVISVTSVIYPLVYVKACV